MQKQKLNYETPEVETLVVRFEEIVCTSPGYGSSKQAGGIMGTNNYGDSEEDLF